MTIGTLRKPAKIVVVIIWFYQNGTVRNSTPIPSALQISSHLCTDRTALLQVALLIRAPWKLLRCRGKSSRVRHPLALDHDPGQFLLLDR